MNDRETLDRLINECYSKELSTCDHTIFQRQKFINLLLTRFSLLRRVR